MKTPLLETERLMLRPVCGDDAREIFECWMSDQEVSRYMWWKASSDIRETERFIDFELDRIDNDKWYRWIIVLKASAQLIGTCLVYRNEEDDEAHWDVSYNLGRAHWGKGYITEAMRAAMRFAEEYLDMRECITAYALINRGSASVLRKLGFVDEKEIPYECEGGETVTAGMRCRWRSASEDHQ